MGEYIKHRGTEVKIGTCESLYYVTYPKYIRALKDGLLSALDSNSPEIYAKPNSGFRFRFPFPDEDKLPFGDISGSFNRAIPVTIDRTVIPKDQPSEGPQGRYYSIEIEQQKLVNRQSDGKLCLALVYRDPETKESFRIEDDADIKAVTRQIIKHHVVDEKNQEQKSFYREIASRILQGYRLENPAQKQKTALTAPAKRANSPKPKRKGRSI